MIRVSGPLSALPLEGAQVRSTGVPVKALGVPFARSANG